VTVFIFVVAGFTLLLMTPWATHMGLRGASFIDALFTAVSAVCVTGLTTVDTGLYWSPWGLAVICAAMKVGGLGIMTVASLLGLMVSRRVGLTQKMLTASETKTERLGEVGALLRVVIIASTALEVIIMLLLLPRFLVLHEHVGDAIGTSVFLGISAFNNGGIVPTHQGILPYANDPLILLPLILGVFVGSLGFPVILNIVSTHKKGRRPWLHWNLHSRLTITMCLLLVFAGFVAFLALEWTNADTFGPMGVGHKMLNALFSSVMTRSGGFSTVSIGAETEASWLVTNALMFVGGGSAGTGGGIKVTTLAVLLLAIRAEARGDHDVEAMGRRIPKDTIRLAIAVMMVGATIILVGTLIMLQIAQRPLDVVLFEVLSAFGTVGLSTGMTPALPTAGKLVLCMLMFVGRTGTITFAAALAQRDRRRVIRYPEERPIVG
jgi:Trk-type K+ transport system membrane component